MTQLGVFISNLIMINSVALSKIEPGIINKRGPNLSKACPITGDSNPLMRLPGKRIKPAVAADNARGPCINTGKMISEANIRSEEHTSELQSRGHLVCRL